MTTSQLELSRIVIDAVAFFLVTTDLYGARNLKRLTGRLDGYFRQTRDLIFRLIMKNWAPVAAAFAGEYLPPWSSATPSARRVRVRREHLTGPVRSRVLEQALTTDVPSPELEQNLTAEPREHWWEPLVGAAMLLPAFGLSLVTILPSIIILGLYALVALGLFLLNRYRAKGLLLLTGTFLFLVARSAEGWVIWNG
jgi:hypothetical protein